MIIYLHIPKTAGSTINQILIHQYRSEFLQVHAENGGFQNNPFDALTQKQKNRVKLISGHFSYGIHHFLSEPAEYFTMLRNPVERLISLYYFIQRRSDHPLYESVIKHGMTLEEFVICCPTWDLDNVQTRLLAGDFGAIGVKQCRESLLLQAQANVCRHFSFIGLQDKFDMSMLFLSYKYGWQLPFYAHENVTKNRPRQENFSPSVIEAIKEINAFDISLYNWASERFDEMMKQQPPSFFSEVTEFQRRNQRMSPSWVRFRAVSGRFLRKLNALSKSVKH